MSQHLTTEQALLIGVAVGIATSTAPEPKPQTPWTTMDTVKINIIMFVLLFTPLAPVAVIFWLCSAGYYLITGFKRITRYLKSCLNK